MSWYQMILSEGSSPEPGPTPPGPTPVEYPTWQDASDSIISMMINQYYREALDLTEIWSIGDTRTMSLGSNLTSQTNAIETTGTYNNNTWSVGESHRKQNVELVIIDFNHDDLTTPIQGPTKTFTKAILTVQQKDCLRDVTVADYDGKNNTENGYMNSTHTNVGGWTQCARRAWCNGGYYQAIPIYLRQSIKPVNKLTSAGDQNNTINTDSDYIFLLSEIEIFNLIEYSITGEGNQYQHFTNAATNRCKMPIWNSDRVSGVWWERSPRISNSVSFCIVNSNNDAMTSAAGANYGLVPAFCL